MQLLRPRVEVDLLVLWQVLEQGAHQASTNRKRAPEKLQQPDDQILKQNIEI
jgi:hypothetical protein